MTIRWGFSGPRPGTPTVPPPVPVAKPMSTDQPPADFDDDARPLTTTRLRLSGRIGEPDEVVVETIAREGLTRQVLVGRALPLLARARRLLDQYADPTSTLTGPHRAQCARMADAIADLIGHSTTDSPPAPELEAVLAEGTPARLTWEQIKTLPRDYRQALTRDQLPLEPAVPAETAEEKAARHERIHEALDRMGVEVIPPCPMAPYAECSDPAPREKEQEVASPALPPHDYLMPHRLAGAFPSREEAQAWEDGVEGCPTYCPRRLAAMRTCASCLATWDNAPGRHCQTPELHVLVPLSDWEQERQAAVPFLRPESSEPAAPVEETPQARAGRLDRERETAGKAYRAAIFAADEAWRAIGGRP